MDGTSGDKVTDQETDEDVQTRGDALAAPQTGLVAERQIPPGAIVSYDRRGQLLSFLLNFFAGVLHVFAESLGGVAATGS